MTNLIPLKAAHIPKYLKFIAYKDFHLWDVKRYLQNKITTRFQLVSIKNFARKYTAKVEINDAEMYKRIRIKAYGKGAELRDIAKGEEIKTKSQFLVKTGQFIFSKIDARNGAFGIVSDNLDKAIITNSFSVYDVNNNIANTQYLYLITKTAYFQELCEQKSSGTTGRRNISDEHFINFQIPLPTLAEQNKIINNYYEKINRVQKLEKENEEIRIKLEQTLFENVTEEKTEINEYKKLRFVEYTQISNWSVSHLVDTKFSYSNKFPLLKIGDFLIRHRDIINIDDETIYKRVKVKINSNGVVLRDTEKGINIGTKKQYLAKSGQFIVSKIDARNGAFGVIPEELNGSIVTNDFPLYDVDTTKINPRFLPFVTTTKEFIKFTQSCSSGTTNRQRMDIDMFLNQKIPLPTLTEQEKLVGNYYENIKQIEQLKHQAETEFEETVFGNNE